MIVMTGMTAQPIYPQFQGIAPNNQNAASVKKIAAYFFMSPFAPYWEIS